jgi:hypothetical protein
MILENILDYNDIKNPLDKLLFSEELQETYDRLIRTRKYNELTELIEKSGIKP